MDILEELEWLAEQLGGASVRFKRIDALVNHVNVLRIAAEAERDELKSKLAEMEKQEHILEVVTKRDPDGFPFADIKINGDFDINNLPHGTKLYAQPIANNSEPVYQFSNGEDEPWWDCSNYFYKSYLGPHKRILYGSQVTPNNSEQVQRITEQDAREIANCFIAIEDHDWYDWLTENGNTLLAKLNGDENA